MKIIKRGVIEIDLDNSKVIMNNYHFNGDKDKNVTFKDLQTIEIELALKEINKILNLNYKDEIRPSVVYNNADYYF